jgi:hypothetical protein
MASVIIDIVEYEHLKSIEKDFESELNKFKEYYYNRTDEVNFNFKKETQKTIKKLRMYCKIAYILLIINGIFAGIKMLL